MEEHGNGGHGSVTLLGFLAATVIAILVAVGGQASARAATSSTGGAVSLTGGTPAVQVTAHDPVARSEYVLLEEHARWLEQQWDPSLGAYTDNNGVLAFAGVLENAVLIEYGAGQYDPSITGVSEGTLEAHTVSDIRYWAAQDRLTGGARWGKTMFFDSTFELYFEAAAELMWSDLDSATQANVDQIMVGQADYTAGLGAGNDPLSPGWTPDGFAGNWQGDTKIDEMAVYAQSLAPAVAWDPSSPESPSWTNLLQRWTLNQTGLPPADQANPTVVAGQPVSAQNTAHNIYDTFIVENHGSFEPHYLEETWRTDARDGIQFLLAGDTLPAMLTEQPNTAQLWRTIEQVSSAQGEPFMPMIDDRYHLYGRDVLPLAFLSQVEGNRDAARAEADLVTALQPYLEYPPTNQLTKFSGQPSYEPEAGDELGISYLLHLWRDSGTGVVTPVTQPQFFADASGATDYGDEPGLLAQQSPRAFAATVSKPGFTKFVYAPGHDDWLFDVSGTAPSFLPSTADTVESRYAVAYHGPSASSGSGNPSSASPDGFNGTGALLHLAQGYAGYTTLPTGAAVYATSGTGPGEGAFQLFNLDMPGIRGLDGSRTFAGADGTVNLPASSVPTGGDETQTFPAVTARYVRMQGVQPATQYGYSLYDFSVFGPGSDTDLALDQPTTASSYDDGTNPTHPVAGGHPPQAATDGDPTTRWAVSIPERSDPNSWIEVDLGSARPIDEVTLDWEAAYASAYKIEVSDDGQNWTTVATAPAQKTFTGNWLNIDGEAGFVVHGSTNPIDVTPTDVTLSDGPANGSAGMIVDAYPDQSPAATRARADIPAPTGGPSWLRASVVDGYLSLFDLSGDPVDQASLRLPQSGRAALLYDGVQTTADGATDATVSMDAATARVEAPRFRVTAASGALVPSGLLITVNSSRQLTVDNRGAGAPTPLTLTSLTTGQTERLVVSRGTVRTLTFGGPLLPNPDLALQRTTFPDSPIPPTMNNPAAAVDGDPATAWSPGRDGRMVVDLGSAQNIGSVVLAWSHGPIAPADLSVSQDGLSYQPVTPTADSRQGSTQHLALTADARYLAVTVPGWSPPDAALSRLSVYPPG
jgi:hypothetical protein